MNTNRSATAGQIISENLSCNVEYKYKYRNALSVRALTAFTLSGESDESDVGDHEIEIALTLLVP